MPGKTRSRSDRTTAGLADAAARRTAGQIGFWVAVLLTVFTAVAFGIGVATTPISGPFCRSGCFTYPYAGVASYVPHDYIWMLPAMFVPPLFLIMTLCVVHDGPRDRRIYGRIASAFAMLSAALLSLDYYLQLTFVQPSLLRGETDGLALFLQYNPHGVFIAIEDLGYLAMSIALFFIARAFAVPGRVAAAARWLLSIGSLLALGLYIVLTVLYGNALEYRFEVLAISINWTVLIASGILFAVLFWRELPDGVSP